MRILTCQVKNKKKTCKLSTYHSQVNQRNGIQCYVPNVHQASHVDKTHDANDEYRNSSEYVKSRHYKGNDENG